MFKKCLGCGEEKSLDEFYQQEKGRLGRTSRCKVCVRKSIETRTCRDCGKPIGNRAARCRSCASKMRWATGDNDGLSGTMRKLWKAGHFNGNLKGDMLYRDVEWLREQYVDAGLSLAVIADKAGCTASTIARRLQKHGIPRRSQSETTKAAWARGCWDNTFTEEYRQRLSESKKSAWARGDYANRKPRGPNRKKA